MQSGWGRALGKKLMKGRGKPKPDYVCSKWNIVSGDVVRVVQGPQEGQQGKVLEVLRKQNRILVEGVNVRKRAVKPGMDGTPGRMVTRPCTVHYSNVMLVDPTTGEPTKVSRRFLEDGTKVRVSKKSGHVIEKPDPLANRQPRNVIAGAKDTEAANVMEVTFDDYERYLPYIYASEAEAA
jgi:large subunit ribosomal protein L24